MTEDPRADGADDSDVSIEQARWLLEWYNKRSESFSTRAVAVLGFDGVILALLVQGFGLSGLQTNCAIWVFLAVTGLALLVSATYAVCTIVTIQVEMPGVDDLRDGWAAHRAKPAAHKAAPQTAESLLHSTNLSASSPVDSAKAEADTRAERFTTSVYALLVALVSLAILAALLLAQL